MAKRVMDCGNSMHILATENAADEIRKISKNYAQHIHLAGNFTTKHGEPFLVYNIYGKGWGNRNIPQTRLKQRIIDQNPFSNPYVDIRLDVKDPKSMLVHHTWVWDEVNISNKPIQFIPCIMDGIVKRSLPNSNITLTDGRKNKQEIETIVKDHPNLKHLIFRLKNPIKPNHKKRLKLEYDWEEPDREFEYTLSSDCKEFRFQISVPKGMDLAGKVFRFDPVKRLKELASIAPKIIYQKDKTIMTWRAKNLISHDGYRFHW